MKRLISALICLAAWPFVAGCGRTSAPAPTPAPQAKATGDDHGHEHSHGDAPHGGTLIDWGGGAYHVEFTVDHSEKEATVYVLGDDAKSAAPIRADKVTVVIDDPFTELELTAQPLEGEAEGTSSRFVGTHDTLGTVREFSGAITGVIDGTPYTGEFKEEPHGVEHKH